MSGKTPRRNRPTKMVVEDEVLRVGPIVRNLARIVVAHDVEDIAMGTCGIPE